MEAETHATPRSPDVVEALSTAPAPGAERVFPRLTAAQLARVEARGTKRSVAGGDVLFEPGQGVSRFFIVTSGAIEIVMPTAPTEQLLGVLEPGMFTGEVQIHHS